MACLKGQSRILRGGQKLKYIQKNLNFEMEILNPIACIFQVKYGAGMEGKGAKNNG